LNQNPEQLSRDNIDSQLLACDWLIKGKEQVNISAGPSVAIREYQTEIGQKVSMTKVPNPLKTYSKTLS